MIRKAFTFVELLSVMAIIGILASMLIGVGLTIRNKAKDATTSTRMEAILTAAAAYSQDGNGLAYVLQNRYGDNPVTGGFGGSKLYLASGTAPYYGSPISAPWKEGLVVSRTLKSLDPQYTYKILEGVGVITSQYVNDVRPAPQEPWNDSWGNPLAVGYLLYQPPQGSGAGQSDEALTKYGYNRSITLAVAAIGPNPTKVAVGTVGSPNYTNIWDYVTDKCDAVNWKTDGTTAGNSFSAPPWKGTKSYIQNGDRCQLTAPLEIR